MSESFIVSVSETVRERLTERVSESVSDKQKLIAFGTSYMNFLLPVGRLNVGDEILRVNGQTLEGMSYADCLTVLRDAAASGGPNSCTKQN